MARRLRLNSRMGLTSDDEPINRRLDGFSGPGLGPGRLQRVQPAQLADAVVEPPPPAARSKRTHPLGAQAVTGYDAVALPFDDPRHPPRTGSSSRRRRSSTPRDWARWLDLLTDDVRYLMPVRVTTVRRRRVRRAEPTWPTSTRTATPSRKRVERLLTEHAWTEDPPSRTRHLVTNVRTFAGDDADGRRARRRVDGAAVPQPRRRPRAGVRVRAAGATSCAAAGRRPAARRGARSPSTRPCCARRTWRSSCEQRGAGDRSRSPTSSPGRRAPGRDPQRRAAADRVAPPAAGDRPRPARAGEPHVAVPRPVQRLLAHPFGPEDGS